jgi:putative isomerase
LRVLKLFLLSISLLLFQHNVEAKTNITFDLKQVPFSYFGSYLSITQINRQNLPSETIYIRNSYNWVLKLELIDVKGNILQPEISASPYSLVLKTKSGQCEVCYEDINTLRFKCKSLGVRLTRTDKGDVGVFKVRSNQWGIPNLTLTGIRGSVKCNSKKEQTPSAKNESLEVTFDFYPDLAGISEFSVERSDAGRKESPELVAFESCKKSVEKEFDSWLAKNAKVAKEYQSTRDLALYVNWSAVVSPYLRMSRCGMYMSKNWMAAVWSWDNCFNAMATAKADKKLAMDQIYLMFDKQLDNGAFPDLINDNLTRYDFVKPPIYGITLTYLEEQNAIPNNKLSEIYERITKLTNYWLNHRDSNGNGLPEYSHGNDSGWDNTTAFDGLRKTIESADLCAYLITQMDYLSGLAKRLVKQEDSQAWGKKSEKMLDLMVKELWKEGRFVSRNPFTGKEMDTQSQSLISLLPIIIGDKLPADIKLKLISDIKNKGYLTDWGLATESTQSVLFNTLGEKDVPYWRGSVWAPSTYMIVHGLKRCGEVELARLIQERFCAMCVKSGFAENFDALTGEGLCDPSYTWTSSVFLLFCNELSNKK